jgi:hypothetical protein
VLGGETRGTNVAAVGQTNSTRQYRIVTTIATTESFESRTFQENSSLVDFEFFFEIVTYLYTANHSTRCLNKVNAIY